MRRVYRGATTCLLFVLFGLGALLLVPVMLLRRGPERGQPVVRQSWRFAVWMFERTGMVRAVCGEVPDCRGTIIVANHPSLIDVVLLTARLPRTIYVAKTQLRRNPFLAAIVRATAVPGDASMVDESARLLAKGWNILIFPEGTRSPRRADDPRALQPLHRGAARLAVRTGAPVLGVGLKLSHRVLAKGQPPWDMGVRTAEYEIRFRPLPTARINRGESERAAAVRITADLARELRELIA